METVITAGHSWQFTRLWVPGGQASGSRRTTVLRGQGASGGWQINGTWWQLAVSEAVRRSSYAASAARLGRVHVCMCEWQVRAKCGRIFATSSSVRHQSCVAAAAAAAASAVVTPRVSADPQLQRTADSVRRSPAMNATVTDHVCSVCRTSQIHQRHSSLNLDGSSQRLPETFP